MREYLEEVAVHLPRRGRSDVLREMESHLLDRIEEESGGTGDEATVRAVLERFGEPARVASAYAGDRYLIGPGLYRAFVAYTGILYVAHLIMILVGVATGAQIHLFPARIAADGPFPTWFELLGVAVHTLLFDIGLMVVIFALASRSRGAFRTPSVMFRVRRSVRASISRVILAVVAGIALTLLRDRLFVVLDENRIHSVLTDALVDRLPWILGFLGLAVLKEIAYAVLGECRRALALDAAHGLIGAALMVVLVAGPTLVAFPATLKSLAPLQPHLNDLVRRMTQLLLIVIAVALAAGAVKRVVRLRQIWA
jgi:hypothetical protein